MHLKHMLKFDNTGITLIQYSADGIPWTQYSIATSEMILKEAYGKSFEISFPVEWSYRTEFLQH